MNLGVETQASISRMTGLNLPPTSNKPKGANKRSVEMTDHLHLDDIPDMPQILYRSSDKLCPNT